MNTETPLRLGKWRDTDVGFVHETEPGAAFDTSDEFDADEPLALWIGLRNALLITAACVMTGCRVWGIWA